MTAAPLLMMAVHDRLSARLAGLALTQSLQLAVTLQWMVRQSAEVENNMTSGAAGRWARWGWWGWWAC